MRNEEYKELQRFTSKRNIVSLIACEREIYVNKKFLNVVDYNIEKQQLTLLGKKGCKVPKLISCNKDQLLLSYIKGKTLLDVFEDMEARGAVEEIDGLAEKILHWLHSFYMANMQEDGEQTIKGDMNFRNFLLSGDSLYGIDFEQVRLGTIEEDIGRMSAFALMYDPIETSFKYKFVEIFIDKGVQMLGISKNLAMHYQSVELNAIKKRRNK